MSDKAKYTYAPTRSRWGIWGPEGKIEEYSTREEARKRVYELNGWHEPKTESTMDKNQFMEDVRLMRKHQKEYFKTRSSEALRYAKHLEKRIDAALDRFAQEKEKQNNLELFNS